MRGYRKLSAFLVFFMVSTFLVTFYVIPPGEYVEWTAKAFIAFAGANLFEHVRKS